MLIRTALLSLAAMSLSAVSLAAVPAPHVTVASFDQLAKPLPLPYDEQANADAMRSPRRAHARSRPISAC